MKENPFSFISFQKKVYFTVITYYDRPLWADLNEGEGHGPGEVDHGGQGEGYGGQGEGTEGRERVGVRQIRPSRSSSGGVAGVMLPAGATVAAHLVWLCHTFFA